MEDFQIHPTEAATKILDGFKSQWPWSEVSSSSDVSFTEKHLVFVHMYTISTSTRRLLGSTGQYLFNTINSVFSHIYILDFI